MNYTAEMTEKLREEYLANPNRETVAKLAKDLGKSEKSIIGKLAKEGIYQRESYTTKTGEKPITKNELVADIESILEVNLAGLEKTPKLVLKRLLDALS